MKRELLKALKSKQVIVGFDSVLTEDCDKVTAPLKSVLKMLQKCSMGIWTCDTVSSLADIVAKRLWLEENCKGISISGHFWFVKDENWDTFVRAYGCHPSACEIITSRGVILKAPETSIWEWLDFHELCRFEEILFIDNCVSNLSKASASGVQACHVNNFYC